MSPKWGWTPRRTDRLTIGIKVILTLTFLADYSACRLLPCWFLAEIIPWTLRMEAIYSSETSVDTQRTKRRFIPEDDTFQPFVFPTGA
jgi:hypothetical protein